MFDVQHLAMIAIGLASALFACGLSAAEQANPAEARLREALRNTMLQLRTAETERATLQAAQAEHEEKIKTLTAQVAALTKQSAADKDAADKKIGDLNDKLADREKQVSQLKESLEKWQAAQKQAADVARAKEQQRAKLASDVIALQRRVAEQQTKNAAMFKIGNEILTRYEKFGLGEALTAREPFTGITRVKLQSLAQDYADKLADEKIKPPDEARPQPQPTPTPAPAKGSKKQASNDKASGQKAKP
jgi:hypothetical protein